jgi:hypothetical protein
MNAHVLIVFLIAYFAKVSGHLEFSWLEFLTPFCVLVAIAVVGTAFKDAMQQQATDRLKKLQEALDEKRDEWERVGKR